MNYPTVEPLREAVLRTLRRQVKKKQTLELTESEAKNLMGSGLTVASLGAVSKGVDKDGVEQARPAFDGTNGVRINRCSTRCQARDGGQVG